MQLGMDVSIQQTQKLALTPQMEQSLSVLQMGTEELNQCIEEEVLSKSLKKKRFAVRRGKGSAITAEKRRKIPIISRISMR